MYPLDSIHTWHVAKTGNDGNGGHAQQYPISLTADAKLTINVAVAAAAAGDTIIIWPGSYAEAATAGSKALVFQSSGRGKAKIVPASGDALTLANDCVARGLALEALATNAKGLSCLMKERITIEDCDVYGAYDGLYAYSAKQIILLNSRFRGQYDGGNLASAVGIRAEGCTFQGLGTYATNMPCRGLIGVGQGNFRDCNFLAERSDVSDQPIAAVHLSNNARAMFGDCTFEVSAGADHTGRVSGVSVSETNAIAVLNGGVVFCAAAGTPSAGPFDLDQVTGRIKVANVAFETLNGSIEFDADVMPTTEPDGPATTVREMIIQNWRRMFKKAVKTETALQTYKDDDSVNTTQALSKVGSTETVGDAGAP